MNRTQVITVFVNYMLHLVTSVITIGVIGLLCLIFTGGQLTNDNMALVILPAVMIAPIYSTLVEMRVDNRGG